MLLISVMKILSFFGHDQVVSNFQTLLRPYYVMYEISEVNTF
jgi:hypothetical protein